MPSRPPFFVLGSSFFPLSFTGLFRYTVPSLLSPVFPLRLGGFSGLGKGGGWYYPLVSLLLLSRCLFVLFHSFSPAGQKAGLFDGRYREDREKASDCLFYASFVLFFFFFRYYYYLLLHLLSLRLHLTPYILCIILPILCRTLHTCCNLPPSVDVPAGFRFSCFLLCSAPAFCSYLITCKGWR